jgi:large subunit ribosomal protein L22
LLIQELLELMQRRKENLQVQPNNAIKQVKSSLKTARISPRKLGLVADSVRGKNALAAIDILRFQRKKAAGIILKVVNSGIANAKNNYQMSDANLVLSEVRVGPGTTFKKGRIAAKGRFKPILKRTTNIMVVLTEKENIKKEVIKEDKVEQKN